MLAKSRGREKVSIKTNSEREKFIVHFTVDANWWVLGWRHFKETFKVFNISHRIFWLKVLHQFDERKAHRQLVTNLISNVGKVWEKVYSVTHLHAKWCVACCFVYLRGARSHHEEQTFSLKFVANKNFFFFLLPKQQSWKIITFVSFFLRFFTGETYFRLYFSLWKNNH